MTRSIVLLGLAVMPACSSPPAASCTSTDDCPAGHACYEGACKQLCNASAECSPQESCSDDGVCVAASAGGPPRIDVIESDGDRACPDTPGANCLEQGIIVVGAGLADARFELRATWDAQLYTLASEGRRLDEQVYVLLPNVAAGSYILTAANAAGSADASLTLLQGPTGLPGPSGPSGPAGPPGSGGTAPTADELLGVLNGATLQLASTLLPIGDAPGQVAAGDHVHDGADIVSGVVDSAYLPVGTAAGDIAAGDHAHAEYAPTGHSHAGYADATHDHAGQYLQQLSGAGPYYIDSVNGATGRTLAMTATTNSFCFLTEVSVQDVDGGTERSSCRIYDAGGTWILQASSTSGDDNDAFCQARCLSW